jgi:hypothetical protein
MSFLFETLDISTDTKPKNYHVGSGNLGRNDWSLNCKTSIKTSSLEKQYGELKLGQKFRMCT